MGEGPTALCKCYKRVLTSDGIERTSKLLQCKEQNFIVNMDFKHIFLARYMKFPEWTDQLSLSFTFSIMVNFLPRNLLGDEMMHVKLQKWCYFVCLVFWEGLYTFTCYKAVPGWKVNYKLDCGCAGVLHNNNLSKTGLEFGPKCLKDNRKTLN